MRKNRHYQIIWLMCNWVSGFEFGLDIGVHNFTFSDTDWIWSLWKNFGSNSKIFISVHHWCTQEMITIRFAGWISGRIVSLQQDTDIQELLSNGNRIRISETLFSILWGFRLFERVAHCTIIHLVPWKHIFSLLCHDSKSDYSVISVP